jgi:hypothetical protein
MESRNTLQERVNNLHRLSQTDPLFVSFQRLFFANGRIRYSDPELAIVQHTTSCSMEVIGQILRMGFNFNKYGMPLYDLIDKRRIDVIEYLLQNGVEINNQDYLKEVARNGDVEIFNLLVKYRTDFTSALESNLMHYAIRGGSLEIVEYLSSMGFVLDYKFESPLSHSIWDCACGSNKVEMFEYVIKNCPCEFPSDEQILNIVVQQNAINILKYLTAQGKNIDCIKQKYLAVCTGTGQFMFVKIFLECGADPSAEKSKALRACTDYVSQYQLGMDNDEYEKWWSNRMTAARILLEYGACRDHCEDRLKQLGL